MPVHPKAHHADPLPALVVLPALLLSGEARIVDVDVDLDDPQAREALDPIDDVAAHGLGYPRDGPAVGDLQRRVHRRLDLAACTETPRDSLSPPSFMLVLPSRVWGGLPATF